MRLFFLPLRQLLPGGVNPPLNMCLRHSTVIGILQNPVAGFVPVEMRLTVAAYSCDMRGMKNGWGMTATNEPEMENLKLISLAERRVFSASFRPLYDEGMRLVEQAAEYLDGEGRAEAKRLSRLAATLYAAESMRLTTRLMQIASWLLLQRAANSGEMTRDQVASEKTKVRLDTASALDDTSGWSELPDYFKDIVARSLRLQSLVRRMDDEIYGDNAVEAPGAVRQVANPVSDQITLLNTAFGRS